MIKVKLREYKNLWYSYISYPIIFNGMQTLLRGEDISVEPRESEEAVF